MAATTATLPDQRTSSSPSASQLTEIYAQFHQDGFAIIPGIFADKVNSLRRKIDLLFANEALTASNHRYDDIVMVRLFELDSEFQDILVMEPIISIAEHLLGEQCHLIAQNVVRNPPGRAISNFHVDEEVQFPLPQHVEHHDPLIVMPIFVFTVQILLSDVPDLAYGPTQFVPGSQYSGRNPNDIDSPLWKNRGAVSIYGKAGDIYLHNGQCWHRGAPNTSDRTRYLLQLAYGRRWMAQRFYPFTGYALPQHVLNHASGDERMLRVLGHHPKGPYG
jgi:ectoine hydroxylase-related dioxygenase (phytanoyl-CoA dioxygenase family)